MSDVLAGTEDRRLAAVIAFDIGEIYENLGDQGRALVMYQRAVQLDRGFDAAAWALRRVFYRQRRWTDLATLIDAELTAFGESADRMFEAAVVAGFRDAPGEWRARLGKLLALAPDHRGGLLEQERLALSIRDTALLVRTWDRLAALEDIAPSIRASWLVAMALELPDWEAGTATLDRAAALATDDEVRLVVLRARTQLAFTRGNLAQQDAALEALHEVVVDPAERAAIRLLHASLVWTTEPARAWRLVAAVPPRLLGSHLVDVIEIAASARAPEVAALLAAWRETAPSCEDQLARWSATVHVDPARRPALRFLLEEARRLWPGNLALLTVAECELLAGSEGVATFELAMLYIHYATETGDLALLVQAATILLRSARSPAALGIASGAIKRARELAPDDRFAQELELELAEANDDLEAAIAIARRDGLDRAIRVAVEHDAWEMVVELERERAATAGEPADAMHRIAAELSLVGRHGERDDLVERLVDADPIAYASWQLDAGEIAQARGDIDLALARYDDAGAHDRVVLLRCSQGRWGDHVANLLREALERDGVPADREFREAAWILEFVLARERDALTVYSEWSTSSPDDPRAWAGVAWLAAAIGITDREVAARVELARIDPSSESR
ncbi:MAG TPA: hypothetical protein VGC41_10280, partial [Kofleriaceae bacterium]